MAYENLTTFTEVDPGNHITATSTRCTHEAWQNESAYLYKDYTAAFFGDFTHDIDVRLTGALGNNRGRTFWQLANGVADFSALLADASENYIAVYAISGSPPRLILVECNGTDATNKSTYNIATDTTYYLTIIKTGTSLVCRIYSDSARTALLNTLSITLVSNYTFRYLYVANSWNNGIAEYATGWCENLDINAPEASDVSASGQWPREYFISGYLPRYQKRQIVGYHSASGDLRPVEVNASGHLLVDVEVEVSSGQHVVISGQPVTISGGHVYIESGAYGTVEIQSGGVIDVREYGWHILSGEWRRKAVCNSGEMVVCSGLYVVIESGIGVTTTATANISGDAVDVSGSPIHVGCAANIRTGALVQSVGGTSGWAGSGSYHGSGGISLCVSGLWCSGPIHTIIVKNLAGNDPAYIGGVNCKPYSGYGFLLAASEAVNLDMCDVCDVWIWIQTSGQNVTWIATDY